MEKFIKEKMNRLKKITNRRTKEGRSANTGFASGGLSAKINISFSIEF